MKLDTTDLKETCENISEYFWFYYSCLFPLVALLYCLIGGYKALDASISALPNPLLGWCGVLMLTVLFFIKNKAVLEEE